MEEVGILYISKTLSQLLGIPVRVYKDKNLIELYALVNLIKDPFILEDSLLDDVSKDIIYRNTKESLYYCLLNTLPYQIVVGPFSYFSISKQHIADLAFTLDIPNKDKKGFESSIQSMSVIPLLTVLQSLCSYNYVLNNRMLNIEDITINEEELKSNVTQSLIDEIDDYHITEGRNSTLDIEQTLSKFVEDGNLDGFKSWIKSAPAIRAGAMSNDYIRHQKDTFIVATTIFSRAAIHGGLSYNEALDLSDQYIKKCETSKTYEEINNLNYQMTKDYIQRVQRVKSIESPLESSELCL